jgi:hypothetical protein
MVHDRNHFARNSNDAWDSYIKLKRKTDVKIVDLLKKEQDLELSIEDHKKEFADLSECTEQLIEDTRQLQKVVHQQKRENTKISGDLRDKALHAKQLSNHVTELQSELKDANNTLAMQQELIEEIERSRDTAKMFETRFQSVSFERDEAHRAVIHLTSVISGQITYIERVLASLVAPSRPSSRTESRNSRRRSFQSVPGSPVPGALSRRNTVDFSTNGMGALNAAVAAQSNIPRSGSPLAQVETPDEGASLREKVGAVASTVRKINQQCLAAIQELNDKRAELDAEDGDIVKPEVEAEAETEPESPAAPFRQHSPTYAQNLVSRLLQQRREEAGDHETMSQASSHVSRDTRNTYASAMSSVPDLESRLSTIRTDSASDLHDDEYRDTISRAEVRIQSIVEEEEEPEIEEVKVVRYSKGEDMGELPMRQVLV